ncbi:MAG: AAA family ATPase [Saprospiraceae bacterium]|nr:ATP-binding protein [Lewinella sp.]
MKLQRIFSDIHNNELFLGETVTYLFREMSRGTTFVLSTAARKLAEDFQNELRKNNKEEALKKSLESLSAQPVQQFRMAQEWLRTYLQENGDDASVDCIPEAAWWLIDGRTGTFHEVEAATRVTLDGFRGDHPRLKEGKYHLDYPRFMQRFRVYEKDTVPRFRHFHQLKRKYADRYRKELRIEAFQPRIMSAFVRNQLIDEVYLPIIGDNLAKQIGTAGENTRTDRMGLLLLLSPPGYGKTTLMEYIANRLGLIFMKIDGPTLGQRVTSLDPEDAPNRTAGQELEKLNLAFEMGDNVMIYIDDIQHCHSEFLQKFIALCDGQRRIEGVWKGEAKTYHFRDKRVAVVMAGNPYTESGERFRIPDMLANRADIYNLGDIIGGREEAFKLSYLENALTSNPVLSRLAGKSMQDVHALIRQAGKKEAEPMDLEAAHSPGELREYLSVLQKLIRIRDVILKINRAYIQSAAMAEVDRTAPPFKLQGSYRNMNKLAEKVVPIMQAPEIKQLILDHYEGELQTLTSGAEANRLQLHQLMGILTKDEEKRWKEICLNFRDQQFRSLIS